MSPIDWRELYASNRAVIERAGGAPGELPAGLRAPLDAAPRPAQGLAGYLNPAQVAGESGTSDEQTFTVAGQTRRALVHAPAGVEPHTAVPLVCMLHGCTQDAASLAAATLMNKAADRYGFVAVYPQQERGDKLEALAGELKRLCGAGGTAREDVIEIQGDHRERIAERLRALGHKVKLAGG